MKKVKRTAEYTVYERNDGRYAVKNAAQKWVNGEDKVEILRKEGLLKAPAPKKAVPAEEAQDQQEAEQAATDAEAEKAEEEGKVTGE